MKSLCFLFLIMFSTYASSCAVGPRDPSWSEMLTAAQGAVLVRVAKVQDAADDHAIFRIERVETISDPRLLFRGRTILGVEASFVEPRWHDRVVFWAGSPAGGVRNGSCEFFQRIDPDVLHLLLLGVDGTYALEPIEPKGDRWLDTVRAYYAKSSARAVPKILLPDTLRQITVVKAADCAFDSTNDAASDSFLACVRRTKNLDRIRVTLMLDQGRSFDLTATGDEPMLSRRELIDALKTDFGWPEHIPLRAVLDGSGLSTTGTP